MRVIARNALLARCSGLWRVLARRPTDNPTDPIKRLKTAYRALKKNQKNLQKSVDERRRWVYNALDGEKKSRAQGVCGHRGGGGRACAHSMEAVKQNIDKIPLRKHARRRRKS